MRGSFGKGVTLFAVLVLLAVCVAMGATPARAGLVYSALRDGTWRIYYQADVTAEPEPIGAVVPGDGSAPALAPDGQRVAFEAPGQVIQVCPLEASAACQEVRPSRGDAARPAWHPVTGALLFVRYLTDPTHEESDILAADAALEETQILIAHTGIQDYPDVAPDGRTLAYTSSQTVSLRRSGVHVVQHLWLMNLETGAARQLTIGTTQDIHPDWSPSGAELVFASDRTGQFEIWVMSADGGQSRQLTSGSGAKTWPAWSPDGESIMFTLAHEGRQGLWLIDADGSNRRPFEPFGGTADIELRDADWR